MTRPCSTIDTARAEALFASTLATGSTPDARQATQAIGEAVRHHGGVRGCAAEMAGAFGDHPDTAVQRMRWARAVVQTLSRHNERVVGAPPVCRVDARSRHRYKESKNENRVMRLGRSG
jgi:hypothetical protein